jgi:GNAT superfamily N-acetyltransferase
LSKAVDLPCPLAIDPNPKMPIHEGYITGCIGDIVSLHSHTYSQIAGFGAYFEAKVAAELAEFVGRLPCDSGRIWLYVEDGRVKGSLIADGEGEVVHLRWFVLDPDLRGHGIGRQLVQRAVEFIDANFSAAYLWTFSGLDAARHLYEANGFALAEERVGQQWGTQVIEQRFERARRQR